jgi:hypothetical protein
MLERGTLEAQCGVARAFVMNITIIGKRPRDHYHRAS